MQSVSKNKALDQNNVGLNTGIGIRLKTNEEAGVKWTGKRLLEKSKNGTQKFKKKRD